MAIQYLNGINVSGDVGIGTDSPQKPLDVNGEVLLRDHLFIGGYGENDSTNSIEIGRNRTGDGICFFDMTTDSTTYTDYGFRLIRYSGVNANTELIHRGTGDFRIKGQDASTMTFYTGNSARMRITSSGNVGIGTTNPSHKLHVVGANNDPAIRVVRGNNTSQYLDIRGYQILSQGNNMLLTAEDGMEVRIGHQSNTQRMTIKSSGSVGIGTTSPGSPLEVNGVGTGSGVGEGIRVTREGVNGQYISIDEADGSRHRIRAIGDKPFDIFSSASSYGINLHTNSSQRMTITNMGNVGIGTTSPDSSLHIAKSGESKLDIEDTGGQQYRFFVRNSDKVFGIYDVSNTSTWFRYTGNATSANAKLTLLEGGGNVGIGTTSPGSLLHVEGNKTTAVLQANQTGTGVIANFKQAGNSKVLIDNSGNVGIGTTSPGYKLDIESSGTAVNIKSTQSTGLIVQGGANSTDIAQFKDSTGSTEAVIDTNGNVGIGTASPSSKLQVAGTVKSSGLDVDGQANSSTNFLQYTRTDSTQPASISYDGTGGFDFNLNGGTVKFSDTNGGSVGIGTASPAVNFQVGSGTTDTESRFYFNDGSYTSVRGYGLYMSRTFSYIRPTADESQVLSIGALNSAWETIAHNALFHTFGKDSSEFMRINSSGNVGIGTTSPSAKLHISSGTANEDCVVIIESDTDNNDETSNPRLELRQDGGSVIGRLGFRDNTNSLELINNTAEPLYLGTNNSTDLTILSNGDVGIGITSPSYPLDVNGTVDATSFRAGGVSKYTIYNSTNTYENYGTTISNIASSPVGYLYHDLLAFNYNYTITQEVSTDGTNFSSETLDKRLFSQKQDQAIEVVSSSEYAVRWTIQGTAWNGAKFINLAFTYTNPHPETRVIIESSTDGTTWTSSHDSTASGITGTKSCYVSSWNGNNYVRITISKTSSNTNAIKLSSIKMMTTRAGDQGDGMELQYPYVWDENRNVGLGLSKGGLPTSKLDVVGATNTSNSSLLRLRSTSVSPNAPEKVASFYYNTNTERGYIAVNQYAVTYSTSSDYRLKENVAPISNGIERLKELNPCRFNFIGANYTVDGFLAHETAEVVPESVTGKKDAVDENNEPIYQGIDQSKIVPLLTAALKEAIEKIEQLETRIQTLENN